MRTRKNILFSTFVGLQVEIARSSQQDMVGLRGKVVDETKNLIIIEKEDGKEIKIQKVSSVFRFTLDDGEKIDVEGKRIAFRPHERPKKV